MSTSILYHGFGVVGYRYKSTSYQEGSLIFTIEKDPSSLRCPSCRSPQVVRRGTVRRWFRTVPIGSKRVAIGLHVPRVFCRLCQVVRQITLGFADHRRTYTRAFERYTIELSDYMTIKDVAVHLGVSWDVVKEIRNGI